MLKTFYFTRTETFTHAITVGVCAYQIQSCIYNSHIHPPERRVQSSPSNAWLLIFQQERLRLSIHLSPDSRFASVTCMVQEGKLREFYLDPKVRPNVVLSWIVVDW